MLNKKFRNGALALVLVVFAGVALASVTFNPEDGKGFVGKGDVQLIYGWNNKALQDNAELVQFQASTVKETETTWTCKKDSGENTQERTRTTTTTTQGIVSSVSRQGQTQITGFNLLGYSGTPITSSVGEGPAIGSCPNSWSVSEGPNTAEISSVSLLKVSIDGTNWYNLQ